MWCTSERKAHCSVRGDRMKANINFTPNHTAAHTADKSTIRLLFAVAASFRLKVSHFDIKSVFIHEQYDFEKPVFARQLPLFNGQYLHPGSKAGKLIKNLYRTPFGGNFYLRRAEEYLQKSVSTKARTTHVYSAANYHPQGSRL